MNCLQCGYCCKNYSVMIIDDPEKGIREDNIIHHKGDGPCKHLREDDTGKCSCSVHNYSWYEETPCFAYSQLPENDKNCRMGEYILGLRKIEQNRISQN